METLMQRTRRVERATELSERRMAFPDLRSSVFPADPKASVFPDLKAPARDAEHKQVAGTEKSDSCKEGRNNSGKMFLQLMVGQRVSAPGEEDVMKFSVISFTLPDLVSKNLEIVNAIKGESELLAGIVGNAVSFERRHDSLVGCFGMEEQALSGKQLRGIVDAVYNAVERIVMENRHSLEKDNPGAFEEFIATHSERRGKTGAVVEDAGSIFTDPGHTGAIAYRTSKKFGKSFFRMEWLYKNGEVITMWDPTKSYKLDKFDESIATCQWDKEFIRSILGFINATYTQGARTMIGLQVNNTATIGFCAENSGINKAEAAQERLMEQIHRQEAAQADSLYANLGQATYANVNNIDNTFQQQVPAQQQVQGGAPNSQGSNAPGSGGSPASGGNTHNCTNCGKSLESGQCSCSVATHHVKLRSRASPST